MLSLKLKRHEQLQRNLNTLVQIFNDVKLNDVAASYVTGMPVTDIDTATVLRQHNYDKASTLPNFMDYQKMGIDLSVSMPDCQETKAALDALTSVRDTAISSTFQNEIKFIAYDKKTKQFTVTAAGKQALENTIVTLSDEEEAAFNAIYAAHKAFMALNPLRSSRVFSDDICNTTTHVLRADDVAYYIKNRRN
jgi:hypothetical protein